nr:ankyrin 23:unc44 [Hymenolepis microstoma]
MADFINQYNTTDADGNTPLHYAAAEGFIDGVSLLILHRCYIDPVNNTGSTPLILAMQNQHHYVALLLVNAGASPFFLSSCRVSGISLAVMSGNIPLILAMLSSKGPQVTRQIALYKTFSDVAISKILEKIDILLLICGADIRYPVFNLNPPLAVSATLGHIEMVEKWIRVGAPLERRDTSGLTPLMNAARGGYLPVCQLLVTRGAKLNAERNGQTALSMAIEFGHTEVSEYLTSQNEINIHQA